MTERPFAIAPDALLELQRERDHLLMLHEVMGDVTRAASLEARLDIFVEAIRRLGFGRVTFTRATTAPVASARHLMISDSYFPVPDAQSPSPSAGALAVPVRDSAGETLGSLLLEEPLERVRPSLIRVRTVELFAQQIGSTLERASLEALAERRAVRVRKFREVGAVLAGTLDEETILHSLAQELESTLSIASVCIFSTTRSGEVWARVRRSGGVEGDIESTPAATRALAEAAMAARRELFEQRHVALPVVLAGAVLGVIVVESRVAAPIPPDDVEFLQTIAAQTAAALGNARIHADGQRQHRQMEALADVARAVGESLRLEQVLRLILGHATALLRTDGACISLLRDDRLEVVAGIGTGDALVGMWMPLVGSMNGRVVRTGTAVVGDASSDPEAFAPTVTAASIRNVIIVPLATAEGPVGALNVFNRSAPFTHDAADVLQRFADQVAVAVVNARLFEDVTASRALAERHQRVVETSSDAIVITDLERRIAFANPAAIAFFGHGEALIGMPVSRTLSEEMHDEVRRREDDALAGKPQRYEGTVLLADGERRRVAVTTAPLREHGITTGIVASLRDVTDERRARDAVAQSEARYRNLFESASDAIYTIDLRGAFTSVNEATVAITGYTRGELLGRSSRHLFDDEGNLACAVEQFDIATTGAPARYECRFRRADGEHRLVSITNAPIRHGAEIVGVLGVARDVTDERARAGALARSEARYSRLVESASDAIFTVDNDGCFTAVNRSLELAVGLSRTSLLGTPLAPLVDSRDLTTATDVLQRTLKGERTRTSLRFHAADGTLRSGSVITAPVLDEGVIVGALGIMRDITDEQRIVDQMLQQEKLAAVGQLVSGVAHELNNPLAAVMAFSELLLASGVAHDADTRFAIDTIHHEAGRAAKIVTHLLTFARQRPAERMDTDLNAIVSDTVTLRRYALRAAQIDVDVDLDPSLPRTWADPFQLQQVLLNLIGNAEQALAEWSGPRRILISTRRHAGGLVIAVSDTGPGVAPEQRDRIFNPFFTTKPVGQGTGLGLSISDGIVRQHGGQIRVESQPGQGATFLVELPIIPGVDVPAEGTQATVEVKRAVRRMLVVDDETPIRVAISTFLTTLGHDVTMAAGGMDARALLKSREYDVVILDLRMPDLGGDALFEELRQRDDRHAHRVVFVTGDAESDDARRFLRRAGRPVVGKPFQLDELATVIAGVTT